MYEFEYVYIFHLCVCFHVGEEKYWLQGKMLVKFNILFRHEIDFSYNRFIKWEAAIVVIIRATTVWQNFRVIVFFFPAS